MNLKNVFFALFRWLFLIATISALHFLTVVVASPQFVEKIYKPYVPLTDAEALGLAQASLASAKKYHVELKQKREQDPCFGLDYHAIYMCINGMSSHPIALPPQLNVEGEKSNHRRSYESTELEPTVSQAKDVVHVVFGSIYVLLGLLTIKRIWYWLRMIDWVDLSKVFLFIPNRFRGLFSTVVLRGAAKRMAALQSLRESGVISETAYQAKKDEIKVSVKRWS